jgi:hypothetical protein
LVPGSYDLTVEDGLHCPTTLPNAFTVTNTANVTLKAALPSPTNFLACS